MPGGIPLYEYITYMYMPIASIEDEENSQQQTYSCPPSLVANDCLTSRSSGEHTGRLVGSVV